jgi:hypothetical protein
MEIYSKEELQLLPQKLFDEFLEKKRRKIIFEVFRSAANGKKSLHFRDFFSSQACEIQYVDSVEHLVHDKIHYTIVRLSELIQENFPDCEVLLYPLREEYTKEDNPVLIIRWS